jgi:hypothetical protein
MDEPILDAAALEALTDPEEVEALGEWLDGKLQKDAELLLFISPGCQVCPHQVRSVATVALASPRVALEIVDTSLEPDLALQHEVRAVPTTIIDDELILTGIVPPGELALRLVERQSPEAQRQVFALLVEGERFSGAADRLADGRGTVAFLELWVSGSPELRAQLLQVADEALVYDPEVLDVLVPALLAGLEPGGALVHDDARRADTAELLGRIRHPDARPALERLAADASEEVADAAADALAALAE